MVSMTETIVYVHTVVIEFLYTLVAYHTMESSCRFYDFAIETKVL
jgi:hypothetical protein